MAEAAMQLDCCTWKGKRLVFRRPIIFKLNMNPFSGECILEQDALDIYVFAPSYDEAVRQAEGEVGYIWDEYILNQKSIDIPSRMIALQLSALVASFGGAGRGF